MNLADATALRIGGKDAIEARLNGQVVWSADASDPVQAVLDAYFSAAEIGFLHVIQPQVLGQQRLWQDQGRTVPAENDGDLVRVIDDVSGNGLHAASVAAGAYGILRFDGTRYALETTGSTAFATPTVDLTGVSQMVIAAAVRKIGSGFMQIMGQGSTGDTQAGAWDIAAGAGAGNNRDDYTIRFASPLRYNESEEIFPLPSTNVLTGKYDRNLSSAEQLELRVDGALSVGAFSDGATTSGSLSAPVDVMSRLGSAVHFNGLFYGGMLRAGLVTDNATVEEYFAELSGVELAA